MAQKKGKKSELATLVNNRLEELAHEGISQKQISDTIGFPTSNYLSILKGGNSKLALNRVEDTASAMRIELPKLMLAALKQYYDDDTIAAMRRAFVEGETATERHILDIARNSMDTSEGLSYETRLKIEESFNQNNPAKV